MTTAIDHIGELIFVQLVYLVILSLLIFITSRQRRKATIYWLFLGAYFVSLGWLISEFHNLGPKPDPGAAFSWSMYSMMLPGLITFMALGTFTITRLLNRKTSGPQ